MSWLNARRTSIVDPTDRTKGVRRDRGGAMTPPPNDNTQQHLAATGVRSWTTESPYSDSPDHLTFEEMREMPLAMALGFDISDD